MNENHDKFKLIQEIIEIRNNIRPKVIVTVICILLFIIAIVITLIEMLRLGPLDLRTFGWFMMSICFYILSKINAPPKDKTELLIKLVEKLQKYNDD